MKKVLVLAAAMVAAVMSAKAEVEFAYDAGFEVVSSYIWRGQYNGGLSFQPEGLVGFDAKDGAVQFRAGAWANLGASDWKFKKDQGDGTGYTQFMKEVDFIASFSFYGASVGYNAYYYCNDGSDHVSEVWAGFNLNQLLGSKAGLYVNWYTAVAGGGDRLPDPTLADPDHEKQAFSSYLEVGYDCTFDNIGLTIGAQVGMSPWESPLYYNDKFAVTNVALKINKEWEFEHLTFDLFAQGSLNPDGLVTNPKDPAYNLFVDKAGEDKLYIQRLNGVIGIGLWF